MTNEKGNPLEKNIGNWAIVHTKMPTGKKADIGKLATVGENNLALEKFEGSVQKGCLPSYETIPFESDGSKQGQGIYRIYDEKLNVLYENSEYKV